MKRPLLIASIFLLFSIVLIGTGCKKTAVVNSPPSLTTNDVILDATSTSAQSGGTITSVGTSALTANGVCYSSSNQTPTVADTKTADPLITTSYAYTSNLTGLTPSTTYYVRAYATNQYGTSYGSVVKFTTAASVTSVTGVVTAVAGNAAAGFADGTGAAAQFNAPTGLAVDAQGNVYISDSFNNRIRKITPAGVVTTVAGNGIAGYADGPAANAEFYGPQGLVVDAHGNVFVADFGNNVIRQISAAGVVTTVAGNTTAGYVDGAALTVAEFRGPAGVTVDAQGNLFVADHDNNIIRKVTTAGIVSTVAGTKTAGYINGTVNTTTRFYASFNGPNSIIVDQTGNLFVADQGNNAIREITAAGAVSTIAGGPGQSSLVGYPAGIAIDPLGNLVITDESGRVIELTVGRVLYPLAGVANSINFADGTGTAALFNTPQGIGIDASGNIYVADQNNNRVRKVVVVTQN